MKSVKSFSRVRFFATLWTVAHKDPPSMGFSRQKYWSGLPFPSPGDLPNPGIEPRSPASQAEALTSEPPGEHTQHHQLLEKCSSKLQSVIVLCNYITTLYYVIIITLYVCTTSFPSIYLLMEFRLLPCFGYCEQCCYEHRVACYLFGLQFCQGIYPGVGLLDHMVILSSVF